MSITFRQASIALILPSLLLVGMPASEPANAAQGFRAAQDLVQSRLKPSLEKNKSGKPGWSDRDPRGPRGHGGRRHGPRFPPVIVLPPSVPDGPDEVTDVPQRRPERAPRAAQSQTIPRQVVIVVDQSAPQSLSGELARRHGLTRRESQDMPLVNGRCELYDVRGSRSVSQVVAALRRDPRVKLVQANFRYQAQSGADAAPQGQAALPQYALDKVALPQAHEMALGRDVVVAVIDAAVDDTHPDLKGAVLRSFDAVGLPDRKPGFHGTAVAGIIRAQGAMEGAAPQASILAVRAFRVRDTSEPAETSTWTLLRAVEWAVENKANILNLSFTGPADDALHLALQSAAARRVVAIAAAGNNGPKAAPAYPAAYPEVIAVTAIDEKDRRYAQANRGSYIAVAAPGVDILAPVEKGKHSYLSGTSFATAYVSGIVALLIERNRELDTKAVAEVIAAGADDLGPQGRDDDFGVGRINAYASLKAMERTTTATDR
jgi:subtilisin family serine protease